MYSTASVVVVIFDSVIPFFVLFALSLSPCFSFSDVFGTFCVFLFHTIKYEYSLYLLHIIVHVFFFLYHGAFGHYIFFGWYFASQ